MNGVLIDENLPAGLGRILGEFCEHATDLGDQPTDEMLWAYAREKELIIVTRDADFFDRLATFGAPPKVVWFRTGNLRRAELETLAERLWPRIRHLLNEADLIEVRAESLEAIKF